MKAKSNEQFVKEVEELVGDEYVFVEEYINSGTKIKARHSVCGTEFMIRPTNFLTHGGGCPKCNLRNKLRREEVVERVDKHTDGEFEFVGEFINVITEASFRHKACGTVFQKSVNNFFKRDKTYCEVCHPEARTRPYTDEEFDSKIKTELGSDYELSGSYTGSRSRVNIRHITCGEVYSPYATALSRCPKCIGSKKTSEGEYRVAEVLDKLGIPYLREAALPAIAPRRFDFFLPLDNRVIEFDGQHHFKPVAKWGGEENFTKVQESDKFKNEYCREMGYPILRIAYWEFPKVEELVTKFINGEFD